MSDHADIVREAICDLLEQANATMSETRSALAALDALVAERDEWKREAELSKWPKEAAQEYHRMKADFPELEAEVARLREALCLANLEAAVAPRDENGLLWTEEEDTDE